MQPGGSDRRREAGPGLERAAAGHPPARPRDQVVGQERLHDGPLALGLASTPRWTIWPLVGPTGNAQPSHSPMADGPGAAGDGDGLAGNAAVPVDVHRRDAGPRRPEPPRTRRPRRSRPHVPRPRRGPRPPCPDRRPGPLGACSARWTGPSGGKRTEASSGVISTASPGRALDDHLGERPIPLVLVGPQADREHSAAPVGGAPIRPPRRRPGAPAARGSARRSRAGTATARDRLPCWSRARGSLPRRRSPFPGRPASTTVTCAPGRPTRRPGSDRPALPRPPPRLCLAHGHRVQQSRAGGGAH